MSKYVRYVLTHFNAIAPGVNWMFPASWSTGTQSFYGMPWEIFRTDRILPDTKRPVTFVTKAGGVPDYFSRISLMPEYGLGLTILVGGNQKLLNKIQEIVTINLIRAAEKRIWQDVAHKYSGTYIATNSSLNSSLELASSPSTGLTLNSFVSNGTNTFDTVLALWAGLRDMDKWRVQLTPTLLYKNETSQQGEIWRFVALSDLGDDDADRPVWDDFCNTDIDPASYAGLPINEMVFWHEEGVVELPAWRVSLKRVQKEREGGEGKLTVQLGPGAM